MSDELGKVMRNILKDIRVELGDQFDQNFERQGFFSEKWQKRKSPMRGDGHILYASGDLRRSVKSRSDDHSITFYSESPYAAIHNEGGEIKVTAKMRKFFWHKYYEATGSLGYTKRGKKRNNKKNRQLGSEAEFWQSLALKKVGSTIKIPRRQFLGMAPEVEREVRSIIEKNLEQYFEHDFDINTKK